MALFVRKILHLASYLLIIGSLLSACGSAGGAAPATPAPGAAATNAPAATKAPAPTAPAATNAPAATKAPAPTKAPEANKAATGGNAITATLKEFSLTLTSSSAKEGEVTFTITNSGAVKHEFVVMKTDLPKDKLPLNPDGSLDEDKLTSMGEQGDIEMGKTVTLTLNMHPGHYIIICNLPGHFKDGMYADFTVS